MYIEEFKSSSTILAADERSYFPYQAPRDPALCEEALHDFHARIAQFQLSEPVPDDVRIAFSLAKNVALYSWFAYRLRHVAQLQAFGALELSLKLKLGYDEDDGKTLRPLMEEAVAKGLFDADALSRVVPPSGAFPRMAPNEWLAVLPEAMTSLRNSLSHGSSDLWPDFLPQFSLTSSMIDQLFAPPA